MAKTALCLEAALVCLLAAILAAASAAAADIGCTTKVGSYSPLFGVKKSDAKYVDQTKLAKKGALQSVSLYFQKSSGCLRGAKAVFGTPPTPAMIGSSANTTEVALKLKPGETVTKAEYKSKQCIEYIRLTTNNGRSVSVGSASAPGTLLKSAANKTGNYLVAIRGYQSSSADGKPGALQQLQFVWGTSKCPEQLSMETGSINTDPSVCAPRTDMCNEDASMNQFSYCVWNAPYTSSTCKGGCCISSGKCASSSCAISGMGRDVASMICYGTNAGFGFGGSNLCSGLACKLEVPGCTTDAFGGNCVGTVVPYGDQSQVLAESKRYIGAPCLDATPSDTTLDADGNPADNNGMYMGKLWTICDCSDDPRSNNSPGAMLLNLTTSAVNNLTKNDVLLAISQVLPKVNLTETLNPTKAKDTQLFPSFTDYFKMPTMPTITLPSFITVNTTSSNSSAVEIKLPDLGQLLSSLAAKANNATAAVNAAVDPIEAPEVQAASTPVQNPSGSSSSKDGTKNLAEALGDLKGFLGKLGSNLNKANITSSSSSSHSDVPTDSSSSSNSAPVSIAALPAAVTPAEPALVMPAAMDPAPVQAAAAPAEAEPAAEPAAAEATAETAAAAAAGAAEAPAKQDTPPAHQEATTEPAPVTAEPQPTAAAASAMEATPQVEPAATTAPAAAAVESQPAAAAVEATPAATEAPPAAAAEPVSAEASQTGEATTASTATDSFQAETPAAEPPAAAAAATPEIAPAEAQAQQPAPVPAAVAAPPALATTQGAFKGFSGSQAAIQQILGLLPPEAFMPYDYDEHTEGN